MKEILYIVFFSITTWVNIPCPNAMQTIIDPVTGERKETGMMLAVACGENVTETYTRQMSEEDFLKWKKNVDEGFRTVEIIRIEKLTICSRDTL